MSLKRLASRTPVKWTVGLKRFGNGVLHRIALCKNISGVTSKRTQNRNALLARATEGKSEATETEIGRGGTVAFGSPRAIACADSSQR
jgi:hypothetical protein